MTILMNILYFPQVQQIFCYDNMSIQMYSIRKQTKNGYDLHNCNLFIKKSIKIQDLKLTESKSLP
jgi:hypothetical protein